MFPLCEGLCGTNLSEARVPSLVHGGKPLNVNVLWIRSPHVLESATLIALSLCGTQLTTQNLVHVVDYL